MYYRVVGQTVISPELTVKQYASMMLGQVDSSSHNTWLIEINYWTTAVVCGNFEELVLYRYFE